MTRAADVYGQEKITETGSADTHHCPQRATQAPRWSSGAGGPTLRVPQQMGADVTTLHLPVHKPPPPLSEGDRGWTPQRCEDPLWGSSTESAGCAFPPLAPSTWLPCGLGCTPRTLLPGWAQPKEEQQETQGWWEGGRYPTSPAQQGWVLP